MGGTKIQYVYEVPRARIHSASKLGKRCRNGDFERLDKLMIRGTIFEDNKI